MPTASPVVHAEDKRLVARLLAGEETAFKQFFADHYHRVYRFALTRMDRDIGAAEDAAQATLSRALENLASYRGEAQLFTWLCAICRGEISLWRRRTGRRQAHVVLIDDRPDALAIIDSLTTDGEDPADELERDQRAPHIQVALDRLPPRYGDALEWKYVEGSPPRRSRRGSMSASKPRTRCWRERSAPSKKFMSPCSSRSSRHGLKTGLHERTSTRTHERERRRARGTAPTSRRARAAAGCRRSGSVFELVIEANEQLDLRADGTREVTAIDGYGERWAWAADVAPRIELDGRTTFDVIAWAARETRRTVVYESPLAETNARGNVLHRSPLAERYPDFAAVPHGARLRDSQRGDRRVAPVNRWLGTAVTFGVAPLGALDRADRGRARDTRATGLTLRYVDGLYEASSMTRAARISAPCSGFAAARCTYLWAPACIARSDRAGSSKRR